MVSYLCFLKSNILFLVAFGSNLIFVFKITVYNYNMVFPKPSSFIHYGLYHPPQHSLWFVQTPSIAGYFIVQPGKELTSCTTMYSLTPASPSLVSPATCLVLTSQRTRIMTVSGPPIVTGLPHFLVRYRCCKPLACQ